MKACSRPGCRNQALPGDFRCEDCFAEDQARYDGKPHTVRTDKRPRGEYPTLDEMADRSERRSSPWM